MFPRQLIESRSIFFKNVPVLHQATDMLAIKREVLVESAIPFN